MATMLGIWVSEYSKTLTCWVLHTDVNLMQYTRMAIGDEGWVAGGTWRVGKWQASGGRAVWRMCGWVAGGCFLGGRAAGRLVGVWLACVWLVGGSWVGVWLREGGGRVWWVLGGWRVAGGLAVGWPVGSWAGCTSFSFIGLYQIDSGGKGLLAERRRGSTCQSSIGCAGNCSGGPTQAAGIYNSAGT